MPKLVCAKDDFGHHVNDSFYRQQMMYKY